jgi:hypothetical protein
VYRRDITYVSLRRDDDAPVRSGEIIFFVVILGFSRAIEDVPGPSQGSPHG